MIFNIFNRGGVEDTRLEAKAKAKDTKKSEAKAKDSPSEDRPSRGQGQECSRPRTQAQVFSKKWSSKQFFRQSPEKKGLQKFFPVICKKRSSKIFFRQSLIEETQKGLRKFSAKFLAFSNKISTVQKIVVFSSSTQGNFPGLEASRPSPRTSKCVLEVSTSDI